MAPRERVRHATASNFEIDEIHPLNTIAIEVVAEPDAAIIPLAPGLDDDLFEHDGQLTKREIRAVTLSSLQPLPRPTALGYRAWRRLGRDRVAAAASVPARDRHRGAQRSCGPRGPQRRSARCAGT